MIGAIVDLGNCLNLLDARFIELVRLAYADLLNDRRTAGLAIPANRVGPDLLRRELD